MGHLSNHLAVVRLGVVFYVMVNGSTPFDGPDDIAYCQYDEFDPEVEQVDKNMFLSLVDVDPDARRYL